MTEYKEKHDKIGHYIQWKTCNWILTGEKWYEHQPEPITEVRVASILSHLAIQTDRKIRNNRQDIVVKDYKRKTWRCPWCNG